MSTTSLIFAILYIFGVGSAQLQGSISDANPESAQVTRQRRSVGGNKANIGDYSHQVSIELLGVHICGGSIVSEKWILTAAHCFRYSSASIKVRAGTSTIMSGGTTHDVIDIIPYDKSQSGMQIRDIALVRISPSIMIDNSHGKVELPVDKFDTPKAGVIAKVTGWGITENGPTADLHVIELPIFDRNDCNDLYQPIVSVLVDGQMCAGYLLGEVGKSACAADGGSALMLGKKQIGIVSWGRSCGSPYYPGVYTDVAYYSDWIREEISDHINSTEMTSSAIPDFVTVNINDIE